MIEVFSTLYYNEGIDEDLAIERAQKIFFALDVNQDGDISMDEFIKGCLQDEELVNDLNDKSLEPPLMTETFLDGESEEATC